MKPKYLITEETVKDKSLKQEKRIQRQLASGALWSNKGDLIDKDTMYELKIGKKQVTITKEILEKIYTEGWMAGKVPVLIIEIGEYILIGEVIKK